MKVLGAIVLWTLIAGAAVANPVADLAGGETGRIEFASSNPPHRWALIRGRLGPTLTVWGDLLMPTNTTGKVPAVVLSHGSEGAGSLYYDVWAKALNEAGYAAFVVDSFSPRGRDDIMGPERQLNYELTVNIADALNALKLLSTHPRIDATRIFHMGWSRGGAVALAAAWQPYQQHILPPSMKWAGSIPIYPGCNNRYLFPPFIKMQAPMLILLGEKDDMTPSQPCVEYAQDLAKEGNPVTYKVYAGAHHVFDRLNQPWRKSQQGTYADCAIDMYMPVDAKDMKFLGRKRNTAQVIATPEDFAAASKECASVQWVTGESNTKAREQAIKDVVAFLNAIR